ncbi:MAG: addiction module protein [Cyanobacteriota bacterium]|nr:addiction module protein [Cyanobacteriota bacterium]
MHPLLDANLRELTVLERIQLIELLWDSLVETPDVIPVTEAQQQELDRRLRHRRERRDRGSSWEEVKQRLGYEL